MSKSFWSVAAAHPPIVCRLLARHPRGQPLTDMEIADRSGLTPHQVSILSWNTSWAGVDLPTMEKYLIGCGVNFCDARQMKRVSECIREQVRLQKLNRSTYRYLRRSPMWRTLYEPMMKKLAKGTP